MFMNHSRTQGDDCDHANPVKAPSPVMYYLPFQGDAFVAVYPKYLCSSDFWMSLTYRSFYLG